MPNSVQLFHDNVLVTTVATIQEASDIAGSDGGTGWVIKASAGTYDEHVILTIAVSLQGANAGLDGQDDARGPETIITGGLEVRGDGAIVDGVKISGSFDTSSTPSIDFHGRAGLVVEGAGVTIENSVFAGDANASRPFVTSTSSDTPGAFPTDLSLTHNLVQGWNLSASLVLGSDGSITHNIFSDNPSGNISEGEMSAFDVSDNSFTGSLAPDVVGRTTSATLDLGDFLHGNIYSSTVAQPIQVEVSGPDGQVVNGTDTPTVFDVSNHAGTAELHGGAGSDTISYVNGSEPATIDLGAGTSHTASGSTTFTSIENAIGSSSAGDSITGDDGANVLDGSGGDDAIAGKGGTDTLIGGEGNDSLDGGDGDDSLDGGSGNDTANYVGAASGVTVSLAIATAQNTGGAGTDTLIAVENLTGSAHNDGLTGDVNANIIAGLDGNDTLNGAAGNDTLNGSTGNDTLIGGSGNDAMDGGAAGSDTVSYADAPSLVVVSLAIVMAQFTRAAGNDTLTNFENLTGSAFNDTLTGNAGVNILSGLAGNDTMTGDGGNDTLNGGAGDDIVMGGIGNDTMDGGAGSNDLVTYANATAGVTVNLSVSIAQNTIGAGTDTLTNIENLNGTILNDTLTGNAGANIIRGAAGDDILRGGDGDDTLDGGGGKDILNGGMGNDFINGDSAGIDTVTYADATAGVTVDLTLNKQNTIGAGVDTLVGLANLTGSAFNDTLTGNFRGNVISGLAGNDTLMGGDRSDTLIGGAGNDIVGGGGDNDSLDGGAGTDTVTYADAYDGVSVNLAIATAQNTIGAGADTLKNFENLTGSKLNDTLTGNAAANILNGGAGNDSLNGGAGNDSLNGAAGSDTASYADATGAVKVNLAITTAQNTIGAGVDTLVSIENLTGSNLNDTLTGNTLANILKGGAGNDTLTSGAGDDSLEGGAGNDSLIGGVGNDTLNGAAGNDSMNGGAAGTDTASYQAGATAAVSVSLAITTAQNTIGAGVDTLINFENLTGTAFNDTLTGNSGANVIDGLTGNDTVNGGTGNDTLTGGVGNDTVNGGAGNDRMDGGAVGTDTVSYETGATTGVKVSLAIAAAQNTLGAGTDTLLNFENLTGSGFNDTLAGDAGANTLSGLASNDSLNGAAGDDSLSGGAGNDRLIGGTGNDSLDGGGGADSFIFDKGFWADTITGFAATGAGHDTIDFSTAVFANFAAVQSHMLQSGANVIISLDSFDTLTLKNVTLASLTAADFTFHAGTAPAAPPQAAAAAWATHGAESNSHLHLG